MKATVSDIARNCGLSTATVDRVEQAESDFQSAQAELYDMPLTGSQWGHLAVSGFLWLVIPLAIGLWRIMRAEVK